MSDFKRKAQKKLQEKLETLMAEVKRLTDMEVELNDKLNVAEVEHDML